MGLNRCDCGITIVYCMNIIKEGPLIFSLICNIIVIRPLFRINLSCKNLMNPNRQRKLWIRKPKCQVSIDGRASAEEAKVTEGGKPEG